MCTGRNVAELDGLFVSLYQRYCWVNLINGRQIVIDMFGFCRAFVDPSKLQRAQYCLSHK